MSHDISTNVRVLLVDDHDVLRSGLAVFFETFDTLHLVGEATNGAEAVSMCDALKPDVVLMDLIMPEMDGVEATRVIRERYPDVQVLALTSFDDQHLVAGALEAGAIGYLLKNLSLDELAGAIHAASEGRSTLSDEARRALNGDNSPPPSNNTYVI